ncbi:hypothetical protein [Bowmanella yangjiangensis]|uniref:SPOR domain-containing protein n=1 Tax=Bowmanella yangjiangensis TaxID=2811230 RepID=A0ABS3CW18_9ALTE|nr:hypothetical protein [Bowmanella yangjiangensis]MBN7821314.1 hypothetical protein [Bowmanella yangjiangensis]
MKRPATSESATQVVRRFQPGEELILSLWLKDKPVTEVISIASEQGVKVGLADFFRLADFAVDFDLTTMQASGWVYRQDIPFSMQQPALEYLQITLGQQAFVLDSQSFSVEPDDVYVELASLAQILNFNYEMFESQLKLVIHSNTPFPVEQRLARLSRGSVEPGTEAKSVLPLNDSGYQLFSTPLLDAQISATANDQHRSGSYSVLSSQDFAYLNSQFYLSGLKGDLLQQARLTLSKSSAEQDLLGALSASYFALGDVTPVNPGGQVTQAQSRGFSVNNLNEGQLGDNQQVNLTGDVQAGWDVELYRNGVLLDSQLNIENGRYEFNDVELSFGSNNFELVFYGPQGQIERKTESIVVDSNSVAAGQGRYQLSMVDANRTVFGVNDPELADDQLGLLTSAVFDYGLTDWLSVGLGTSHFVPKAGENQTDLTLRTNVQLWDLGLLNTLVHRNDDGSKRLSAFFRTGWLNSNLDLSYIRNENLVTDAVTGHQSTDVDYRYNLTHSGTLFSRTSLPISYQNNLSLQEDAQGQQTRLWQNAIGLNSAYGSVSHSFYWQHTDAESLINNGQSNKTAGGSLFYRNNFGRFYTRFYADYNVQPDTALASYGANLLYRWAYDLNAELQYSRDIENDLDQLYARLNWRHEEFTLSANASYNSNDNWTLGMTARFSVGYDPSSGNLFASNRTLGGAAGVSVRVFEDLDMDNQYDESEPLIEGVKVKATQSFRSARTNEQGVAMLTALPNNRQTDIVVDENSFKEFYITTTEGVSVPARPGFIQQVDIPVAKSGELDGSVYFANADGSQESAPRVKLNLRDLNDNIVASTRSEYDGYYLFTNLLPGKYRLEIDPDMANRQQLRVGKGKRVNLSNRGDLITGADFVLAPLESASGYVATAGQFHSPALLKLYYQLLKKRVPAVTSTQPFYIKSKDSKQYVLGLAYFEGDRDAANETAQYCQQLAQQNIPCKVEYHNFAY